MGDANDGGLRPDRCGTCRYWDQEFTTPEDRGVCRRRAPAAAVVGQPDPDRYERFPQWPLTLCDEWCGEWAGTGDTPGT